MKEKKERQEIEQSANDFFGQMASHFGGAEESFGSEASSSMKAPPGKGYLQPMDRQIVQKS